MNLENSKCLLTERNTALHISVSQKTLQNWRLQGKGPKFIRLSRGAVRYRLSDLEEWIESNCFQSTTEADLCA